MKRVLTATALLMATTGLASAEGSLQLYNWGNRDFFRMQWREVGRSDSLCFTGLCD